MIELQNEDKRVKDKKTALEAKRHRQQTKNERKLELIIFKKVFFYF